LICRYGDLVSPESLRERFLKFTKAGLRGTRLFVRAEQRVTSTMVEVRVFLSAEQTGRVPSGIDFPEFRDEKSEIFETKIWFCVSVSDLQPVTIPYEFKNVRVPLSSLFAFVTSLFCSGAFV